MVETTTEEITTLGEDVNASTDFPLNETTPEEENVSNTPIAGLE